ncbi:MAG TPA: PspC domain-containing protein [Candidatus Saccharimonadales bacterium]
MNEVKKIHLGRTPFTIAVDAHRQLRTYLEAIEHQAGRDSEVVKEVELRMAELLMERGIHGDKVVLPDDVEFLKSQLGEPGDFTDEGYETRETGESEQSQKRLFRDTQHGMIAGVCAGIASFFGLDVVLVRLIFVLVLFFGGAAIPIYLLLWLVMPEAKTPSDRLQMQGKAVTVGSIKGLIDRADVPGAAQRANQKFGIILSGLGKFILTAMGISFCLVGLITLMTTAVLATYTLVHGAQIADEVVFPIGAEAVVGLFCAVVVAMIVTLALVLLGLAMFKRRWFVPGWVVATAVGVLIAALAAGTAIGLDIAPGIRDKQNAMHHTQMLNVTPFKNLTVIAGMNTTYEYQPDSKYSVEVKYFGAAKRDLSFANQVKGDTLTIDSTHSVNEDVCHFLCLYNDSMVYVIIHAPSVDTIHVAGNNTFLNIQQPLNQQKLSLTVDGGSFAGIRANDMQTIAYTRNDDGTIQADLSGFTAASDRTHNTVNLSEGNTLLGGNAKNITVTTHETCDEATPTIDLFSMPDVLTINGQQTTGASQRTNPYTTRQPSSYNCVGVGRFNE